MIQISSPIAMGPWLGVPRTDSVTIFFLSILPRNPVFRAPPFPFRFSSRHIHRSRNESLKQESTEKERNPVFFRFCFVPSTILPDRQQLINNFILVRLRDHAKDAHQGEGKKSLTLSLKSRNFRFPPRPKMYPFRPVLLRNCCFHRDFDSFSLLSA